MQRHIDTLKGLSDADQGFILRLAETMADAKRDSTRTSGSAKSVQRWDCDPDEERFAMDNRGDMLRELNIVS